MEEKKTVSVVLFIPAGHLAIDLMGKIHELAAKHSFGVYLSNPQNIKLVGIPEDVADEVKSELVSVGADLKAPGKMLLPKVCIGSATCNLSNIDTAELSSKIVERCGGKEKYKAKLKIAVSGCPVCCTTVKLTDIGLMATKRGFDVFAGGKGGSAPAVGIRILKDATEEQALDAVAKLVDFHDKKTEKKQRIFKLLSDPEFPYTEV